jgi:hypothetical protein
MGWFGVDCASSSYSWADPGCIIAGAGATVGSVIDSATKPIFSEVNKLLWTVAVLIVIVLLLIGFAPNVKHVIPHFV